MRPRPLVVPALLSMVAAVALMASACGSGVSETTDGGIASATTEASGATPTTAAVTTSTTGGEGSTTTADTPSTTTGGGGDVPDPTSPEGLGDDAELDGLAEDCFDGDFAACDQLFFESPADSDYEAYGDSCGGRNEPGGLCVGIYGEG